MGVRKLLPLGEGWSPVKIRSRMMRHDTSRSLGMHCLGKNRNQSYKKLCSATQRFDETSLRVQRTFILIEILIAKLFIFFHRHFFLRHGQPQTREL